MKLKADDGAGNGNRIPFQISKPHRNKVLHASASSNCSQNDLTIFLSPWYPDRHAEMMGDPSAPRATYAGAQQRTNEASSIVPSARPRTACVASSSVAAKQWPFISRKSTPATKAASGLSRASNRAIVDWLMRQRTGLKGASSAVCSSNSGPRFVATTLPSVWNSATWT